MLNWNPEDGWEFSLFGTILVAAVIAFIVYRNRVRRKSLRKRDDGTYIWLEWHGGVRTSHRDPSEKGGEWDSDDDGDGGD